MKTTVFSLLCVIFFSCQFSRSVIWNMPGLDDHHKMPKVSFKASEQPYRLPHGRISANAYQVDLIRQITNPKSNTEFLLIVKGGEIIYRYDKNRDTSRQYLCFSISKSFIATTFFIAVQEGYISSVNDPVTKYLPELLQSDSDFAKITLSDLLNMRSGLKDDESIGGPGSKIARMYYGRKAGKILENLKTDPEDRAFRYINVNTQILASVIEKSTGKKLQTYFYEKLWSKLQPEHPAYWMMDNKKDSTLKAFVGFAAAPSDAIRLGMLYAAGGVWQGRRILDQEWVAQISHPDTLMQYPYFRHFWSNTDKFRLEFKSDSAALSYYERHSEFSHFRKIDSLHYRMYRESPTYQAYGFLDQFICINPKTGVVVMRTGRFPEAGGPDLDHLIRELTEGL